MAKTVRLHLDDECEDIIDKVLKNTKDYDNESQIIRACIRNHLHNRFYELLLDAYNNEKNER